MQNLSISCALVCLIVLGSAALVGAFGVFQHQISAVLVTGFMYLLAGINLILRSHLEDDIVHKILKIELITKKVKKPLEDKKSMKMKIE